MGARGGQTGRESRCPKNRRQEINADGEEAISPDM
jgi:hypothetical protein